MAVSDPEARREYAKKHYRANASVYKERARAHTVKQRKLLRQIVDEEKAKPCADCGATFPPICMDFDHAGSAKDCAVADMVRRTVSVEKLLAEIAKCEVVCSNCHRLRTAAVLAVS